MRTKGCLRIPLLDARSDAIDPPVRSNLDGDSYLPTQGLDLIQSLAEIYCLEPLGGAPVAVASDQVAHFSPGILGR